MRLVGLAGHAGAGKDTAAAALIAAGWDRAAFADPIRALALDVNPRIADVVTLCGWDAAKRSHPEVRQFLQILGGAARRHLGDDVWIRGCLSALTGPTVVTDVRLSAEARAIRDRGGRVVRIERPGVGPANGDITERALDDCLVDAVVVNDGTVGQLRARLLEATA